MPLKVDVTPDGVFAKQVQDTLARICGCQSVAVDPSTGVVTLGAMSCECYCDHRAGCNLLKDLVGSMRPISIYPGAGGSGYENDEVGWFPWDEDLGDKDVCGVTVMPAWVVLAHELVHAHFDSNNEDVAVRGENQVRLEACMPMRTQYTGDVVPDFRVGVLDARNWPVYGCGCSFWRKGFCRCLRRVLCYLHSAYCFPSKLGGWWTGKKAMAARRTDNA